MRAWRRRIAWLACCAGLAVAAAGCGKYLAYPSVEQENTASRCSDGIDNDLNGKIDCEDPSCDGFCPETTQAACSDGRDNDGDGLVDSADPSCWPVAPPQVQRCAEAKGVDIFENFDVGPQWSFPGSPWHTSGTIGGGDIVFSDAHPLGDLGGRQDLAVFFSDSTNLSPTVLDTSNMGALVRQWAFSGNWQDFALSFGASVPVHTALRAALVPLEFAPALDRPIPGGASALFSLTLDEANGAPTLAIDVDGRRFGVPLPLQRQFGVYSRVRATLQPDGFDAVVTFSDGTPSVEVRAPRPISDQLPPSRLVFWGGSTTPALAMLDDVRLHVAVDRPCGIGAPQIPGPSCTFAADQGHGFGRVVSLARGDQGEYCAVVTASRDAAPIDPQNNPETLTAWRSPDGVAWTPAPGMPSNLDLGSAIVGAGVAHDSGGWHVAVAYGWTEEVHLGFASSPTCGPWGPLKPGPTLYPDSEAPSYVIADGRHQVYFTRPPTDLGPRTLWVASGDDPESMVLAPERLAELPAGVGAPVNVQRVGSRDLVLVYPTAASAGGMGTGVGFLVGAADGRSWKAVGSSPVLDLPKLSQSVETGEGRLAFDSLGVTSAALSWDSHGGFLFYGGYSSFGWSGTTFLESALSVGTAAIAPSGRAFPRVVPASEPRCGDGTCDASETCASCAADCPCPGPLLLADAFNGQRAWSIVSGDPNPAAVQYVDPVNSALDWAASTALDSAGQPNLQPPPTWSVLALPRTIAGDFELSFDLAVSWVDYSGPVVNDPVNRLCSTYIGLGTRPDLADPTGGPDGVFARIARSVQCFGRYMATPFVQSAGTSFGVPEPAPFPPVCKTVFTDRYVPTETSRRVVLRREGNRVTVTIPRDDGCGVLQQAIPYASALGDLPNLLVGFGSGDGTRDPAAGFAPCPALHGAGSITNLQLRLLDDPDHCPPNKPLCAAGSQQPTCVDTSASLEHCGTCEHACGVNEVCSQTGPVRCARRVLRGARIADPRPS